MTVADYCGTSICTVSPRASLQAAAEQMRKGAVSLLLVDDTGQSLGVITDRDLVVALADPARDADSARVADAMSQPAIVIRSDAPLSAAISLMRRKGVRRLPVIDDSHPATGVLAADDIVRLLGSDFHGVAKVVAGQLGEPAANGAWPHRVPRASSSRTAARQLRKAVSTAAGATLAEVAAQLKGSRGGCVIVVGRAGEALGIITVRDLAVRAVAAGQSFATTLAASVMSSPLVTGEPTHTQQEILAKMATHGIRRIPIVEKGRLIGLVSLDDLLVNLGREFRAVALSAARGRHRRELRTRIARVRRELTQRAEPLQRTIGQVASRGMRGIGRKLAALGERLRRRQS